MPPTTSQHTRLNRRLMPLYIAAFLQSCVFWYSIEKLFMTTIGFTAGTIGLMAASYSVVMLVIETPSGLLADRWSRKGILMIASVMLGVSSLIQGLSHSVPMYILGAVFWGIFYALYSGIFDPIVYDTLLEDAGHTDDFKRYYGVVKLLDGSGLVVGALAGGVIGAAISLRSAYFLTIPVAIASGIALLWLKEPRLHRAEAAAPILKHLRTTLKAALTGGSLFGILIILVAGTTLSELLFEFNQLWLIAANTPVGYYGLSMAVVLSTVALSGLSARYLLLKMRKFVVFFTSIMIISSLILGFVHLAWLDILALSVLSICLLATGIIYLERFHDGLPSNVRSGASSAVSTVGRVLFIAMALGFGTIASSYSVFAASWLITVPVIVISIFLLLETPKQSALTGGRKARP